MARMPIQTPDEAAPASAASILDTVFEGAAFGIAVWDVELCFVRVNPAFADFSGLAVGDHPGRAADTLMGEEVLAALRQVAESGHVQRGLGLPAARDEDDRSFEGSYFPVREGDRIVGVLGVHIDVTEQVRAIAAAEDEHKLVTQLQVSLMPDRLPAVPGADIASSFRAGSGGSEVGGDFFDVFRLGKPECWMVVIGDVCGKGAEAAALTALARYTLRAAAIQEGAEPAELLCQLNEAILRQHRDMRFLTGVCAFLEEKADGSGLRLTLCVAGHPPPLKVATDGTVSEVGGRGPLLGVWEDPTLTEEVLALRPGERIVLYTDGVIEAGAPGNELDVKGLTELLTGLPPQATAAQTVAAVEAGVADRVESPGRDDVAMLVVRAGSA
jgi:serine phosphatase RsbU (regulator of sigma subunit)